MGRRRRNSRNLPFKYLFKPRNPKPFSSNSFPSPSSWAWPPCKQPKTLSFRLITEEVADDNGNNHLANLDSTMGSCFTTSSASFEYSATSGCLVEAAMQAVSSNRLLFDVRSVQSFSMKEVGVGVPFEGSVAVEVESEDLYRDFLVSMKEMVEASGQVKKDLVWFEEMLEWYLRMNKKWTYEFIVGAYWDLLSQMMGCSSSSSCSSATSGLLPSCCSCSYSSSSSSYVSCLSEITEEVEEEGNS